jgi:hypothetical protein
MFSRNFITRCGEPTEFDMASYGTVCHVKKSQSTAQSIHWDDFDIYLQVGEDEEEPKWEFLGSFSSESPHDYIDDLIEVRLRKHSNSD